MGRGRGRTRRRSMDHCSPFGRSRISSTWPFSRRLEQHRHSEPAVLSEAHSHRSVARTPPPFGWSVPSRISSGSSRRIVRTLVRGSITGAGKYRIRWPRSRQVEQGHDQLQLSSRRRSTICTRSPSDPCTPASSSRAISASQPAARRSRALRSGSAMSTEASNA